MKLTVGPLPPAVYWRRRAVVLAGVLAIVLLLVYSCGGSGSDANPTSDDAKTKGSPTPSGITYPSEEPQASDDPDASPPGSGDSSGGEGSSSGGSVSVDDAPQCADSELSVAAQPARRETPEGARLKVTLVFTNISDRPCKRDIGADEQEVRLLDGDKRLWSSDDCRPQQGSQVEVLYPDRPVRRFWVTWDGKSSAPKCEGDRKVVDAGMYELVARLGAITSQPVKLKVVAS